MYCAACKAVTQPTLGVGLRPYVAHARCAACGAFLKWVAKALVQERPIDDTKEESCMSASVNRVVLLGTIGKYGVDVRFSNNGTACASFMLVCAEAGQDGKEHTTLVPCEVWGKKAEAAGELEAGQLVLFEGKLRKRQKGENQWELCVSGFEVTPVVVPTPAAVPA
jgi:hypothetical protein